MRRKRQESQRRATRGQKSRCLRLNAEKFHHPSRFSLRESWQEKGHKNLSREKSTRRVFFSLFFFYARFVAGCGYGSPRLATATKNRSIAPAGVVHLFPTLHNISPWTTDDFSRLPSVCLYLPFFCVTERPSARRSAASLTVNDAISRSSARILALFWYQRKKL